MKKTVSIAIAGSPFIIEEDAYHALEQYIKEIKAHFAKEPECEDIVSDIESRIAEQFIESKKKIITSREVSAMIASMGDVRDFGCTPVSGAHTSETKEESPGTDTKTEKRLFRNPDDKVIGGVASGLAAFFGIDVVWVRAAFVIFTLLNGVGVLLYLLFWLSMPEAKNGAQKLEMSGTPVNLETISERIKERVEEIRQDKNWGIYKILKIPFEVLRRIVKFILKIFVPFIGKIIGVSISFVAGIALLALSIGLGFATLNTAELLIEFPIQAIAPTGVIVVFLFALYLALFVPLLFLSFLGTSLVAGKSTLRMNVTVGLLGLWFMALLVGGIIAASYGARAAAHIETAPEYQKVERTLEVAPFTKIEARNGAQVIYTENASSSVALSGRIKDIERMEIKSENGVLTIEPVQNSHRFCIFCNFSVPTIEVYAPMLESFKGVNGVRFEAVNITATPTFTASFSNGSHGDFDVAVQELIIDIQNASWVEVSGTATDTALTGKNGTHMNAANLSAEKALVEVENGSRAEIGETKKLEAKATNRGLIRYKGSPTLTESAENRSRIEAFKLD